MLLALSNLPAVRPRTVLGEVLRWMRAEARARPTTALAAERKRQAPGTRALVLVLKRTAGPLEWAN
jgi:hypothetical protein